MLQMQVRQSIIQQLAELLEDEEFYSFLELEKDICITSS